MKAKRILSLLLSICLLFSFSVSSLAVSHKNISSPPTIEEIPGGFMYTSVTDEKSIAVLTSTDDSLVSVAIVYSQHPNKVYQWQLTNYPIPILLSYTHPFWADVIAYAESSLSSAEIATYSKTTYEAPIDITNQRDPALNDLLAELENKLGTEYSGVPKYSSLINNQRISIYESMTFRFLEKAQFTWHTALTVAGIIAAVGERYTTGLANAICRVFHQTANLASVVIPEGEIKLHICRGMIYRSASINGSDYVYNITDKIIDYKGVENTSSTNFDAATISEDSPEIYYVPNDGGTYFNSYSSQAADAYDLFLEIGQKP